MMLMNIFNLIIYHEIINDVNEYICKYILFTKYTSMLLNKIIM